jgi:hypothetical protein
MKSNNITSLSVALILCFYFLWYDINPMKNAHLLDMVNFAIHEIGHIFFSLLGSPEFITVAGGTIFQITLPVIFFFYFFTTNQKTSSAITLVWLGSNFFDIAIYASDAIFTELPLSNPFINFGNISSDNIIHDWNYMLGEFGILHHANLVANVFRVVGGLISLAGIAAVIYFSKLMQEFLEY